MKTVILHTIRLRSIAKVLKGESFFLFILLTHVWLPCLATCCPTVPTKIFCSQDIFRAPGPTGPAHAHRYTSITTGTILETFCTLFFNTVFSSQYLPNKFHQYNATGWTCSATSSPVFPFSSHTALLLWSKRLFGHFFARTLFDTVYSSGSTPSSHLSDLSNLTSLVVPNMFGYDCIWTFSSFDYAQMG